MSYGDPPVKDQRSEIEVYHPWYIKCLTDVWALGADSKDFTRGYLHGGDMLLVESRDSRMLVEEELRFLKMLNQLR